CSPSSSPRLVSFFRFSYSSGYHRDLPSFPTRRSSDLGPCVPTSVHHPPLCAAALVVEGALTQSRPVRHAKGSGPGGQAVGVELEDRKSTRLNSSHVKISYAVFCLKKKRKDTKCQM